MQGYPVSYLARRETADRIPGDFRVEKSIDFLAHRDRVSNARHRLAGQADKESRGGGVVLTKIGQDGRLGEGGSGGISLALAINRVEARAAMGDELAQILFRGSIEVRFENQNRRKPGILGGDNYPRHVQRRNLREPQQLMLL